MTPDREATLAVYDVEFVDPQGKVIGTASRERGLPAQGSTVTLEHPVFGLARYQVTRPPDHWYRHRGGRLAKVDQYAGGPVRIYVEPLDPNPTPGPL